MAITPEDLDAKRAELAALDQELAEVKSEAAETKEQRENEHVAAQLDREIARRKRLINEARVLSGQTVEPVEVPVDPEISTAERKEIDAREAEAVKLAEATRAAADDDASVTKNAATAGVSPDAPAKGGK